MKEESRTVFIQNLLWEKNVRNKGNDYMGLVVIKDKPKAMIVQAVHELCDLEETSELERRC